MKKIFLFAATAILSIVFASACVDQTPKDVISSFYDAIMDSKIQDASSKVTSDFTYTINGKEVCNGKVLKKQSEELDKLKPSIDYTKETDPEIKEAKRKLYDLEEKRYQRSKEKIATELKNKCHISTKGVLSEAKNAGKNSVYTEQNDVSKTTYTYTVNGKKYTENVTIVRDYVWRISSIEVTIE